MKKQNFKKAIWDRDLSRVEEYLSGIGNIDTILLNEMTPLVFALNSSMYWFQHDDFDEIILRLIEAGSDVNARDPIFKMTATMLAMDRRRKTRIILELIDAGTDLSLKCMSGKTVLIYAIEKGYGKQVINILLSKGSSVDFPDTSYTPLHCALSFGNDPDIIELLVKAGANVNAVRQYYKPVIAKCCRGRCLSASGEICRYKRVIDLLIRKGADIKETDDKGNSVIHLSTCNYVFILAIRNGISIETLNNLNHTPLMQSLISGKDEKVVDLLLLGANPNAVEFDFYTPFHNLRVISQERFINMLIFYGADFLARNKFNETPFHFIFYESSVYTDKILESGIKALIKHYLLYELEYGLDNLIEIVDNPQRELFHNFIVKCNKELSLMRNKLLNGGISFYNFCLEKRFFQDDGIPIETHQYNYASKTIPVNFTIYKDLILMRLKDNRRKNFARELRRKMEMICISIKPIGEIGKPLKYDFMHLTSKYFNIKQMYILFLASIKN